MKVKIEKLIVTYK